MAHSQFHPLAKCLASQTEEEVENHKRTYQHFTQLVSSLPSSEGVSSKLLLYRFNGWYAYLPILVSTMVAREHFKARPTDVLLVTSPKSGTTWLKALLFATVNRNSQHPFATLSPHECVPFLEFQLYINDQIPDLDVLPSPRLFATHIPFQSLPEFQLYINDQIPDLDVLPSPRLFATHIPFQSLPESFLDSDCRIVYLYRDPKDTFVSLWHFTNKVRARDNNKLWSLDEALELFCNGISSFGPYWDHVLGYWNRHLERPQKVLFLKYEELMKHPVVHLKRLAEFVGRPFTLDEEKEGVVEGIVRLCAFENLSSLEVNKAGKTETVIGPIENSLFFRRGEAGDWANPLTPEMARRLDEMSESKFGGSGLPF